MKANTEAVVTEVARATEVRGPKQALYASQPAAGFPAPGDDEVERILDINDLVVQNPATTFFVRVSGESMQEAGIFSGDVLVVDRAVEPLSQMIVVAAVNGEMVVKYIVQNGSQLELHSANTDYAPITVSEDEDVLVWGVVVGSVRQFRK